MPYAMRGVQVLLRSKVHAMHCMRTHYVCYLRCTQGKALRMGCKPSKYMLCMPCKVRPCAWAASPPSTCCACKYMLCMQVHAVHASTCIACMQVHALRHTLRHAVGMQGTCTTCKPTYTLRVYTRSVYVCIYRGSTYVRTYIPTVCIYRYI
jgi:hypothetical protein